MRKKGLVGLASICLFLGWHTANSFAANSVRTDPVYFGLPNGLVDIITPSGAIQPFVTTPTSLFLASMIFDSSGNLYLGENSSQIGGSVIEKVTPAGVMSTYATGMTGPDGMAFDSIGDLYVSDETQGKIYKITPAGGQSVIATVPAEAEGLAMDSNGNLFVATLGKNVYEISPSNTVTLFASTGQVYGAGLTIDSSNNLYECNDAGSIIKITPAGVASVFGSGSSQSLDDAIDSQGDIDIADLSGRAIESISPGGVFSTLYSYQTGAAPTTVAVPPAAVPEPLALPAVLLLALLGRHCHRGRVN